MRNLLQKASTFYILCCLFSSSLQAKELVIALGNFPPLFSEQGQPAVFKDLIDGVYRYIPSTTVSYRYMIPNSRLPIILDEQLVDGAANIFSPNSIKGCITQPVFSYFDVAITIKSKNFQINTVEDILGKSVVSYQGAKTLLGEQYSLIVSKNKHYTEVSNPLIQAKLLSSGMVDVSIGDKYIFLYSLKNWSKETFDNTKYQIHDIFPPVASAMGFNDQKLCDEFNHALTIFKASGDYQRVYEHHLIALGYFSDNYLKE